VAVAQRRKCGMLPNLYARMAEAPALLQSYLDVAERFARSGLDPVQQQVVLLTVSRVNRCGYCVGVHSVLADMGGVPAEVTNAIRNDTPVPDARLEALRRFTARLVEDRGWVNETEVQTFLRLQPRQCAGCHRGRWTQDLVELHKPYRRNRTRRGLCRPGLAGAWPGNGNVVFPPLFLIHWAARFRAGVIRNRDPRVAWSAIRSARV
jgi:AhpD family alkylhydroperoxidase